MVSNSLLSKKHSEKICILILSLHFLLFVLRRVAVQRCYDDGAATYLHWVTVQTVATSTNKWIQKLIEWKGPYMTGNPSYDKFWKKTRTFRGTNILRLAFGARNPGRVSLPEFPTSATFYVTILSNDQVMPNVESVNDLHSFHHFTCRSVNWASLVFDYLYEQIYGKSTTRMRATSHARSRLHR